MTLSVVSDPLCISINHPLRKWIDFGAIRERFAYGNVDQEKILRYIVWLLYIELIFVSSPMEMVLNGFCTIHSSSAIDTIFTSWSNSTTSNILRIFSIIGFPERGVSLTSKLPGRKTESTKTKLRVIGCYNIRTINCYYYIGVGPAYTIITE